MDQFRQTHQTRQAARESAIRRRAEVTRTYTQRKDEVERVGQTEIDELNRLYEQRKQQELAEIDRAAALVKAENAAEISRIQREFDSGMAEVTREYDDAQWMLDSVHDKPSDENPEARYESFVSQYKTTREFLQNQWMALESLYESASTLVSRRRMGALRLAAEPESQPHFDSPAECVDQLSASNTLVQAQLQRIRSMWSSALFVGSRPTQLGVVLFVLATGVAIASRVDPSSMLAQPDRVDWGWVGVATGIGIAATLVLLSVAYTYARGRVNRAAQSILQSLHDARAAMTEWKRLSTQHQQTLKQRRDDWKRQVAAERRNTLGRAQSALQSRQTELRQEHEQRMLQAQSDLPARLQQLEAEKAQILESLELEFPSRAAERQRELDRTLSELEQSLQQQLAEIEAEFQAADSQAVHDWQQVAAQADNDLQLRSQLLARSHFAWDQIDSPDWHPPTQLPAGIQLGHFQLEPHQFLEDDAVESEGDADRVSIPLPATLPFPGNPSLLIKSDGAARREADQLLACSMLRMLTVFPPGKLRFTVIDPVSLGETFAGFMHLADFDEQLISNRIWTESSQIEKRLMLLTEHMENVFQSYLRNEFRTIQEYNDHAGEVAEPYHVLVVAGFPTNFTEPAIRRILSIATSGERCGVYLLMSLDRRLPLPQGVDLDDLEQQATVIDWGRNGPVWKQPVLEQLELELDQLPGGDRLSSIVKRIGQDSKHAQRVEVAFDRVAPRSDQLWTESSSDGISIPLGRAGATKLQHLSLGHGTSQHVLVAGKTGSGKTTFLHTLITNIALHYSPHEVEFFLVDFKKGVEFKTYATHELPHARVIAIESDREFGLSVLERLDAMLHERGDLFRQAGVADLPAYRQRHPEQPMPRVLLIVDEFQEFFVEDDRIAAQAGLFLDRLVRQGRAFGLHVLLGSQTLAGAYSLARSTLGQVAVRIALQCSESDAHLILSEENTAARLLTRPGEAIYNDANGLVEGNHPFQVAFLSDDQREVYLDKVQQVQHARSLEVARTVIFEGHLPAVLSTNAQLARLLAGADQPDPHRLHAWFGDAVSIKESTVAELYPATGRNILICGGDAPVACGVLEAIAISTGAQIERPADEQTEPSFYVLDGMSVESGQSSFTRLFSAVGQRAHCCGPLESPTVIDQLDAVLQQRTESAEPPASQPPRFLIVAGIGRFRDLRKAEDDYGFGGFDGGSSERSTAQKFNELLKNGSSYGIYCIVWADTFNNLSRWMSVTMLREFEIRLGFQMSASDSSQLFDSPVASRLGPNRGVVFLADEGLVERFRPYRSDPPDWIERLSGSAITSKTPADVTNAPPQPTAAPTESKQESEAQESGESNRSASNPAVTDLGEPEDIDEWTVI